MFEQRLTVTHRAGSATGQQRERIGRRRPVEAVWYTGRMMGETVARTLCGQRTEYRPGHWFNSAKFLDIEYQTYGWVSPEPGPEEAHFHWRHPREKACLTLACQPGNGGLLGINTFGMRLRHEVLDRWLTEGLPIGEVLARLGEALFDPEFYRDHSRLIWQAYQQTKLQTS